MTRLNTSQLLILSFAAAILVGAVLLQLPFSLREGSLGFVDALFTATSAVCVTGLTVKDTGTFFSFTGQLILLTLIQLGGLGILTMSVFILHQMGWRISLRSMEATASSFPSRLRISFRELLRDTVRLTIGIEAVGAVFLFAGFSRAGEGPAMALGHAVFHSVSAFCNAGFSLFSDSLCSFRGDVWINTTVAFLIVAGGIGFFVLRDLRDALGRGRFFLLKLDFRRLNMQSRIVLLFSFFLIAFGAFFFFLLERSNTLADMPVVTQILCSFFQSVTCRTAGFNTVDIYHLSNPTLFLLILLMFIGASPGSTGGGIKVTSFATLLLTLQSQLRGRRQSEFQHRAISSETIRKAVTLLVISVFFVSACLVLLLVFELQGVPHPESRGMFLELLFEAVSAFGTVGLSTGLTPSLGSVSKLVVIGLMFVGRLGPLTLMAALERRAKDGGYRLIEEEIMIG